MNAPVIAPPPPSASALAAFRAEIEGVPVIDDPVTIKRKSRDYCWYSPILTPLLNTKFAELVVAPRSEDDVVRVAAAAARHRIAITPRGGGTGNYGQAVPLNGGVVLDMTSMNRIVSSQPGILRVEPGAKLVDIDAELRPTGWELRMHPSTKRTATIGGFVAGGSGGVGSVMYGGLREPGNILDARIVTLEETPRIIDLDSDAAQKVNRAYGTTGIITRLGMPLAPAYPWIDVAIAFDSFEKAVEFGYELALADGVVKKLVTPIAAPLPTYFGPLSKLTPPDHSLLVCMIAEPWLGIVKDMLRGRGQMISEAPFDESHGKIPLYEYTWNHTTLQVLKVDRSVTYLQLLFPADRLLDSIREMVAEFGDEQMMHLEFLRFGGRVTVSALPVVRYTTPERLSKIIAIYESSGVMVANPHVMTLEDGSRHKRADSDQLGFKRDIDPYGLLNPGKMRTFTPRLM